MAKKEDSTPKVAVERTYNVPLRKEFLKVPRYKRAKKAGAALKQFLERHMKSDDVRIGRHLNMKLWEKGIKNPPHHVNVAVKKFEDGKVEAELVGVKEKKTDSKDAKKKEKTPAKKEKVKAPKKEAKETAPKTEAKPTEKKPTTPAKAEKPKAEEPKAK